MPKEYNDRAPLTIAAALNRLRARAVEQGDAALLETVTRAQTGNVAARSACIRAWYARD